MADEAAIAATHELTDKPFAVGANMLPTNNSFDDNYIAMLKDMDVKIIFCSTGSYREWDDFSIETDTVVRLKEEGFTVFCKVVNATPKNLLQLQDAGIDALAPVGWGAGGCGPFLDIAIPTLIADVRDQVEVPLLAGGGIVDGRTAAAAAAVGAEGAYVGTGFLISSDSDLSDAARQRIIETRAEDLIAIPNDQGVVRLARTPISEHAEELYRSGASIEEIWNYLGVDCIVGMVYEELGDIPLNMNTSVNRITAVRTAAEIVDDIAAPFLA